MEQETLGLKERVESIDEKLNELVSNPKRIKKFKPPRRGRLNKGNLRRGYVIILRMDENKNIDFEKHPLENGTYQLNGGTYHITQSDNIFSYRGRPVVMQATKKINPYNPLDGKNETYGQKVLMARMIGDAIKSKRKMPGLAFILIIIGVIGALYFIIQSLGGG